jgi:putative lipoic acid-binding regulatory protein
VVSEDASALGPDGRPLLEFPTDYPIKVVARRDAFARAALDSIVRRHAPDLDDARISERASREARYIAVTYVIVARSRGQVVDLVGELTAAHGVVMVI